MRNKALYKVELNWPRGKRLRDETRGKSMDFEIGSSFLAGGEVAETPFKALRIRKEVEGSGWSKILCRVPMAET